MFERHSMTCKKMHFVDGVSDRPPRTCDDYMLDSAHAALPVAEWLRFRGSSAQLLAEVMLNSSSIAQTDIDDGLTIQTNGQILGSLGILRARTIELQGGMRAAKGKHWRKAHLNSNYAHWVRQAVAPNLRQLVLEPPQKLAASCHIYNVMRCRARKMLLLSAPCVTPTRNNRRG
jgi:hypothetical protein